MKKRISLIALSCLLSSLIMAQDENQVPVRTKIENGVVEGFHDAKTDLYMYLGIPFAKPPVGELRWKAPQPVDNWDGILETKKFRLRPVQIDIWGEMNSRSDDMDEDCLYLNVWTPAQKGKEKLPVLVYIYGGGFVCGDGAEPRYDGASMAQKGMVTLTMNYRLNVFGFFAHPELSAEASYKASGNYGLLDQAAALKWVQKNIAAFGGDPEKVTIAGESAGSISVSAHMASPLSRDLIAGAIGESGATIYSTEDLFFLEDAEKEGVEFAKKYGYSTLKELRALSTEELLDIYVQSGRFGFPICIDGYFFPKTLVEIFKAGEQAKIPLLLGWNSAEIDGLDFTKGPFIKEVYINKVKEIYPENFEAVLKFYPYGSEREIELSATALASDRFMGYSTWKWFDLHRKNSSQPVYRYLFDRPKPPLKDRTLTSGLAGGTKKKDENTSPPRKPVGAAHAHEIEYCMGNLYLAPEFAWEEEDYIVSKTMQGYFSNFILKGNPNGVNLPEWPAAEVDDATPPVMLLNVESKTIDAKNDDRYLFWDRIYGHD
ncbi:carboxylesterase family protein [candidate division KSB1 bacterium]|nr:carboxylesterase family protein [candidate division KSB1 bacterium]